MSTTNPYPLHLIASLQSEAEKVAAAEGTTLGCESSGYRTKWSTAPTEVAQNRIC